MTLVYYSHASEKFDSDQLLSVWNLNSTNNVNIWDSGSSCYIDGRQLFISVYSYDLDPVC